MPKLPKVTLEVRNVGIYKPTRNLPNVNQPDVLDVENYLGSPFYSYMFVTKKKKSDSIREEEVQEMLSNSESLDFYIQKMSYDLKLQKASMGAILLKNTYVHFKNMRKFIWQHNNPEKVIVKKRDDFLPGFKRLLTRFILLNYCAFNTPGLSGAEWVPETHRPNAFDTINSKYKEEFKNFEWKGQNCRLRHPNPLQGHPKVNFSAYTDDMTDGRVFFLDVSKTNLVDEINIINAEIFQLLTRYLGSLSMLPTEDQLYENEGIEIEMETPSVFEIMEEKPDRGNIIEVRDMSDAEKEAAAQAIHREKEAIKKKSNRRSIADIKIQDLKDAKVQVDTGKSVEFEEQKTNIESAAKLIIGNETDKILDSDENEQIIGMLGEALKAKGIEIDELDGIADKLTDTLIKAGLYPDKARAQRTARLIIVKGLAGKDISKKRKGLIAFADKKDKEHPGFLKISGNSGYKKGGFVKLVSKLVTLQTKKRGPVDFTSVYDMI